jgi:uncharacterized RDD family membrane protein YckC
MMSDESASLYQNGAMYCPNCGTSVDGPPCPVCGTVFDAPSTSNVVDTSVTSSTGEYAGWWRRVGATIVDSVILFFPTLVVVDVVSSFSDIYVGAIVGVLVQGAYMVKLLASPRGQTYGNRVVGTVVRDVATNGPISVNQALARWAFIAVYTVFSLSTGTHAQSWVSLLGIVDCAYVLVSTRKQTLHDVAARTVVRRL